MTSTNDGKDVKSNQTSGPKGKTYYIELYKSLEAGLSSDCELRERTQHLCEAWRRIHSLCQHSAPSTHPHLLNWLQRHTARIVLQTEWQSPKSKEEHKSLEEAINAFIKECENRSGSSRDAGPPPWETQLVARGEWFKKILGNPWGHPVLRVLLDPRGEPPSDEEVLEWLKEERGVMFVTRLRQLTASKCDDLALSLSSAVMERVRASASTPADTEAEQTADVKDNPKAEKKPTFEDILKNEAGFTVDVWELLVDMEFVLLHKGDKRSRCIELAKQTPLRNGYQLVERLQSRLETSPREKKLWKNAKEVATLIAQVVITRCMVVPICSGAPRTALYCCARSLVRALGPRLPPAARALAAPAATARHLHTLAAAVDAQSKEDMKPFVCELYVRAITAGMNELERLKLKTEKEADARSAEQTLASWFTQLGALLSASERIRCECTLTAFSVHPTPAMYERIKAAPALPPLILDDQETKEEPNKEFGSWASDSRGQTNFVKTSETLNLKHTQHQANVLSTAIFSEGEVLGISPELCTDIAVLLSGPRLKTLSWDTDRELLLENCRTYMERTNFGTRALTTELKYLNLDPREFQHLPEEEDDDTDKYYGIEKGYEHLVEEYQEPEEIWQDADDPERTESAHSDIESVIPIKTKKAQKKSKKILSSEDDSDPLSLVAEAKRVEKKKERPHSKERSKDSKERSKEPKKSKSKAKPKDPLEIKDQSTEKKKEPKKKKERKKKEKVMPVTTKCNLSNLIGMRVANAMKKPAPCVVNTPSVSDSGYDNQGKSSNSNLSENNETNVLFDGLFSMDELKSPEKSPDMKTLTKNSEIHIANGTVGVSTSVVYHNEIPSRNEASKHKVPNSPQSRTGSPSNMMVKESLSKLLHYRRQKAIEMEQRINLQPNVVHTYSYKQGAENPTITPAPSPVPVTREANPKPQLTVNVPENPKVYINKTQSEQLSELRNEVNNLLSAKTFGIARPVIQYGPKAKNCLLNNTQISGSRFPNPSLQKSMQDIYKIPQTQEKPTTVGSTESKATPSRSNVPNKQISVDSASPQNFHIFLKELQESINAGAGAHSNKNVNIKKEIKPTSRVTPVVPKIKAEPNTSPQCAKQSQKKTSDFLNTFSRLSYLHKNKLDPKINGTKPVVDALIEYQSKTLQNPPTDAEINRILMEQKLAAKSLQIKNEPVTPKSDRAAYQHPENSQSILKKFDKPKHVSNTAKQNPIIANILSGQIAKPVKPENQYRNVQVERSRETSTIPNKFSSLTERDQQDLLALLRQQTKLNLRPKVEHVKEKVQPPQTITNYSIPCTSQASNKHKIVEAPNITYNNVNIKQVTKPSPSIKPSNVNLDLKIAQTKPLNMVKTEINCTKTVDTKPIKKIEILSNIEIKSGVKLTPETLAEPKEETDWEKVMDAILSHKTPSRGPKALDMALNKDAYNKALAESLRNQRIVKANSTGDLIKMTNVISKGQSKPALTADPKLSPHPPVLSRSNTESVIKTIRKSSKTPAKVVQKPSTNTSVLQVNSNEIRAMQPETPKRQIQNEKSLSHGTIDQIDVLKKLPVKHQEKQFTAPYYKEEDPFISGIPNSDYDLLEALMDDDLRQEIGELSSDEDNYTAPMQSLKGKNYSINKPLIPAIQEDNCLNPTVINTAPAHKKPVPKVRSDIPKTAFASSVQKQPTSAFVNVKSMVKTAEYINNEAKNVQPTIAVHQMPQTVITPSKNHRNQSYHASTDQLRTVDQTNTFVAAIPRQTALKNVVLIGSDIVYQPSTVQTQNTYVKYNNQQNMALYQTTQFAAPVVNPVIIGNAITMSKTTTPITAPLTTVANIPEIVVQTPKSKEEKRNDGVQNKTVINDTKVAKLEPKTNAADKPNDDTAKSEKEKVDINSNKNVCERKVLSEVQEKQKLEKIEPKNTRSQTRKSFERELMNEVIKDHERLQKKRLSIINRNISHRIDKKAIPLSYAPLKSLKIIIRVPKAAQKKYEKVKSLSETKNDSKIQTATVKSIKAKTTEESVEAKVIAKLDKPDKTIKTESCKENKDKPSCRRILLRSSSKDVKLDTEVAEEVSVPRKTKVRLKRTPTECENKILENCTGGDSINKLKVAKKPVTKKTLNKTIKKVEGKKKATKIQPKRNVKVTINRKSEPKPREVIPNEMTDLMDIEDEIITSKILEVMSPDQPIPPLQEIPNIEEILGDIEENRTLDNSVENCPSPSILENDFALNQLIETESVDKPIDDSPVVTQEDANKNNEVVNKEDDTTTEITETVVEPVIKDTNKNTTAKQNMNNTDIVEEIESYVKKLEDRINDTAVNQCLEQECNEIMFNSKDVSETSEQSSQPDRQTSEIIAPVKQNTSNPNINNDKAKHQENTVHIEEDIICIDEDDEEPNYIIPPSKVLIKDGKINSPEKRKNGLKDDLPQSYMDAILIQDLPHLNTGDPLKKCVRIQLPCGKVFKATVHGQMNMDTNSLFSDPALKSVLLSNVSKRTRYTLNIKQISTTSKCKPEKVLESHIHEIRLKGNAPHPGIVVETIDLLSDSDEETQQQSFNTEYGKYQVQRMKKNLLENHQKLFDKKCVVKLKRKDLQKYLDISGDEVETETSVETWLVKEGLPNVSLQTDEPTKNIEPAVEFLVQPITEPVVEPVTQDAETVIQVGVQPMIHPEVQPVIQSAVKSLIQTDEQSVIQSQDQNTIQRDVQPDEHQQSDVQPITKPDIQPITKPDVQPTTKPDDQPITKPDVQPITKPDVQSITKPDVQPITKPDVQPITKPDVQPITKPDVQPITKPDVQPITKPDVKPITKPDVQPINQPDEQPINQPDEQPVISPDDLPVIESVIKSAVQPIIQTDVQSIIQSEDQPLIPPDAQPITEPDVQTNVQPINHSDEQPTEDQPVIEPIIQSEVQPEVQTKIQLDKQIFIQPMILSDDVSLPDVQPMIKPDVQRITQPDVQPMIEPDVTPVIQSVQRDVLPVMQSFEPIIKSDVKPKVLSDVEPVAEQAVVTIAQPGVQAIDQVASESPLTKPIQQEPVEIIEIDDSSNDDADVDGDNSDEENTIVGLIPFLDLDEPTLKDKTAELFIPAQKNNPVPVEAKINEFKHLLFRDLGIEDLAENSTQSDDFFLSFSGAPLVTDSGNSVSNDFSPQIPTLPDCLVKLTRCDELVRKYENLKLLKKCFIKLVRCDELVRCHAEKANELDAEQSDDVIDIDIQDNMFEDTAMDIVPLLRCGSFSILDNCDLFDTQSIDQIDRSNSPVMEAYEAIASLCNRKGKVTVEKVTTYERSTCETEWLFTKPKIHLQHNNSTIEDHRSIERCNAASDSLILNQNNVSPLKALVLKLFHNHSILDQINSARLKSKLYIRRLTPNRKRKSLETIVTDSKIAKNCDNSNQKQSEDANEHFETGGINVMATELLDNTRKDSEIEHDKTMDASEFENSIIEVDSRTSCLDGSDDEISASVLHKADLMQIEFYINNEKPQFQIDGVFDAAELDTELIDEDSIPEIENMCQDAGEINVATDTELISEVGKLDAEEISKEGSEGVSINTDVTPELTKATENIKKNIETLPEIVNITEDILTHEVTPLDIKSILDTEKYDENETEVTLEKSFQGTDTHIKATEMVMEDIWGNAKTELEEMETTLMNTCDEAETKQNETETVMEGICDAAHKKLADPQMLTENFCEDDGLKLVVTGMADDKNLEDPAIVTDNISGDTNTRLAEPEMLTEIICEDTAAILIKTGIETDADTKPDDPEIIMEANICNNADTTMAEAEMETEDICEDAGSKQVDTEMESDKKLDEPKIVIDVISYNTTLAEPETVSENICEDIDAMLVNTGIEKEINIEPEDSVIIIKDICNNADMTITEPEMATEIIRGNTDTIFVDTGIEKEAVIKLDVSEMVREGICGTTDSKLAEQEMSMENVCVEADIEIETTEIEKEADTNLEEPEIVVEGICGDTDIKLAELEMPRENVCKIDTNMEMTDIVNEADTNLEGPEIVKDICNYANIMAQPDKATKKIREHTDAILVDTELENEADKKPNQQEMVMESICDDTDTKLSESEIPTENICENSVTDIETTEIEKEVDTKLEEPEIIKDICKSADTMAEPEKATENICEHTDVILVDTELESEADRKPNEQEMVMEGICDHTDTKLSESEIPTENICEDSVTEIGMTEIEREIDTKLEEPEIIKDICKSADTMAEPEKICEHTDVILVVTELESEADRKSNEQEMVMEGICDHTDTKLSESEIPTENICEHSVTEIGTTEIEKEIDTKLEEPEIIKDICKSADTMAEPEKICEHTDAILLDTKLENEANAKPNEQGMVMEGICGDADTKLAESEMPAKNAWENTDTELETIEIEVDTNLEEPEIIIEGISEDADTRLAELEMTTKTLWKDTELETMEIEDETSQKEPEMVMEGSCGDADTKQDKSEIPTENVWVDPELETTVIQTDTNLEELEMVMEGIFSDADTKSADPEMLMENVCEDAVTEIETTEINSDSCLEEPEMSTENICEEFDAVLVDIETEREADVKTDEPEMLKENVCEDANTEIETTEIEIEADTTMAEPEIAIENICEDTDPILVDTDPILVDTETENEFETTLDETEEVLERTTLTESKMLMENVRADADTETTEIVNEVDTGQEEPEIVMEVICQYADDELLLPVIKQTDKKLEEPEIETDTNFEEPEMVVEVICQYADEKLVLPVIDAETKLKEPEAVMEQLESSEMTLYNISENTNTKEVYSETEIEYDSQIEGSEIVSEDNTNNNDTILEEPEMAFENNSEDADIVQATEIEQQDEPNLEEPEEVVEDICKNGDRKLEEAELEKETDTKLEQPEMVMGDICNNANTKLSGAEMATESMDKKFKQIESTLQMMFADTNSMLEETEMTIENASKEPDTKQDETNIVLDNICKDVKTGIDVEIKYAELGENMIESADKNPAQSDLVRDNSSLDQSTIIDNGAKKNNIVIDFDVTVICEEVDETIGNGEDNIPEAIQSEIEDNTIAETSVIITDDNDVYLNRSKENQTVLINVKLINNDHKPQEVSIECKDETRFYVSEIDDSYLVEEVVEMRSDEILDDEMAQAVLASAISQVNEVSKYDPVSHIENEVSNEKLREPENREFVHVQNQDTNLKLLENDVLCGEHSGSLLMDCEDDKSPKESILITQQIGEDGQIEEIDIKLNLPRRTYSKKYPDGLIFNCLIGDMKNRKRKIDMTDVKIYEKRYRKGKHIDLPTINVTTIGDSGYGKEFKQLLDYCSTVKFSFSRPFHKECIDVQEILQSWPIKGICNVDQSETEKDETLFTDMDKEDNTIHDPSIQTLADEIDSNDKESNYKSCDVIETNFNMGFGEGSGRVIQNLEDGCGTKFSAATLSDVKQTQPLLLSENYGNSKLVRNTINFTNKLEIEKLHSNTKCIQMKEKIRSFFKKSMTELSYDLIKQQGKDDISYSNGLFELSDFPYGLTDPDFIQPPQFEAIVQVVQVGQLPVSAAAQNPVTCDPRVTQVSNVSPSQCSAENSPGDDQSVIKTEYTELTTADLSMPLAQEYVQHIQSMPMPPHGHEAMNYPMVSNYTVDVDIKPEIKIEMEETPEIKEEINDNYENSEYPPLFEKNMMNSVDYSHITPLEPNSNVTMIYNYTDKQSVPETYPHLKQQEHLQMQKQLHQQQQEQEHYQQQQQQDQYQQQQKLIQQQLDQEQQQLQQQQEFQQRQIELQQLQLEQQQQKLQEMQQLQLKQQQEEQKQQHLRLQELKQQQELKEQQEQQEEMQKHQQHLLELKRAQELKQQQQQELKQQKQQELKQQQQRQKELKQQQQLELKQQKRLELKQKQQKQQELKQQQQKQQELKQQQLAQLKQQKQQQQELKQQQLKQQKQQQLQQKQQLKQQQELQQKQQMQQQQELQQKQQLQQQQELQQKQQLQQQQELQQKQQLQQQQELQQKQQLQQQQELQQKQQLQQEQELQQKQQQQELQQKQQQQELQQKQQQQELQQKQQMQLQQELQQKQLMQQQQQELQQKQQIQQQQQEQQQLLQQQQQQNGSLDKTDQIAHAMNAAGISSSADALSNNRAQAIVNMISQKLRQGGVTTGQSSNNFQKTTSINAMALQQALAQILPPPLNQTNASENNQQISNTHTPQVLHIVQGKSSSGNHQQITLVENTQQSVINAPNSTPLLHIVQNKTVPSGPTSNGTPTQQTNSFSGLSLVDGGLQQGNQLLHIVNAGHQKNANAGQLLKRVNLLTNLTNAQGGNEQKMVQFVCKSADGKAIQLNGPHQRSMVLRLQPVETPNLQQTQPKQIDSQDLSPTHNAANNKDAEIKSRSIYEENYAKFIQSSSPKTPGPEKGTSLPKFNQAFGKQVYQDGGQKNEISNGNALSPNDDNPDCQANDNAMSLEHISQIGSPPLLLRKTAASQAQPNLVQQLKQTISPMNLHGGVIYTRQIPVNLAGGQTINLITVPSSDLVDESNQKQQGEIEPSIIKIVPQNQTHSNSDGTEENNTHTMGTANDNAHTPQPQPVLTQMRIKLPMLSKAPQMVSGGRVVRPSFFQIQRNVISGTNQPVYQQLVLTAAPQLGQQTIRLPQAQTSQTTTTTSTTTSRPTAVKATPSESQSSTESMSSSTLEQLREFDLVLEQVKERSTVQPKSKSKRKKEKAAEAAASASTSAASAEPSRSTPAPHKQHQVLYSIGNTQPLNVAYVNRKVATPAPASTPTPTTSTFVRSPDSSGIVDSSPSSSSQIPHTVTSEPSTSSDAPAQSKSKSSLKSKSRPKASSNPPNTLKLNTAPPKPSTQKPAEDEQTTQRILYILAEYKEQVENSPDKDKPAPRRRTNPPSNPGSSKRKRSRRNRDLSPTDDSCRTMGSEDSSCGTSQGDCNESCMDSHSPQDSPRKVVRKLTFEHDTSAQSAPPTPQPRPQPQQRNVIVSDGQTITVARGTAGKPSTAVLMPANYILPVSMIKGGQQIAIVTNRGPKLLTVGGGEGGATNALLLQRLIGPPGVKPLLTRPGVRHVRLPAAALHNLQAFNLATATTIQPPDSTASPAPGSTPPELIETRANSSPWRTEGREETKPERGSSPEGEPWHLPATANPHDYSYEEVVRTDNMDRTVLDPIPDRYSPDMEAQRIFDKMFDVDSKRSYMVGSHDDSPRCGYDIDASDCDDKGYHQVVQKKDGSHHRQHRLTHVSAAALRHKYAILEHELRLQKSLSEECEDLGVDSPSASELFPEAELLFAASPAHDHTQDHGHHSHTPQPQLHHSSIPQPDLDDQIATDQLLPRSDMHDDRSDLGIGLEDVGIVTVSEDGMQATIALDQEEFARSHPNTTFHSEPTDEGEVQPFTISGLKGRHITSAIFHANRAPGTVLMTAPQTTVISQATGEGSGVHNTVKYADIDNMINSLPGPHTHSNINLSSVLVKDDGLTRFDSILNDNRELHLSNTASHIVHATGNNTTQVIRRVCYGNKREQASRFLIEESDNIMARHHAKMMEDSRGFGDADDDGSSPERTELFWESNSASERDIRRPLDFSSDSDKCCKSPSFEENNSTDSSGLGAHMRLDSVIKDARGIERRGSADGSSADDNHAPPLRTYPPKRMYQALDAQRSLTGKTRAPDVSERQHAPERHDVRDVPDRHHVPERQDNVEGRRRASGRGVVKRGCHCCNGDPAPPRPKKPRQRKPNIDFTTN